MKLALALLALCVAVPLANQKSTTGMTMTKSKESIVNPLPPTPSPTLTMTPAEPCYYGPCAKCGESHGGWESCTVAWVDKWATSITLNDDGVEEIQFVNYRDETITVEGPFKNLAEAVEVCRPMVRTKREYEEWQEGVGSILAAMGLGDHARPESCQQIIRDEILPAIAKLRGDLDAATHHAKVLREQLAKYGPPTPPPMPFKQFA